MERLSPESIDFLRQIKNQNISKSKQDAWGKHYTRLFCDLYDIISKANKRLNDFALGKWNISYDTKDDDMTLVFEYALLPSQSETKPSISITIEPFGESSIEVNHPEYLCPVKSKSFYQSAAYKRYFEQYQTLTSGLKTVISRRQITSRHFGSYLEHLLTMMKPYLEASCEEERVQLVAA